MNTAYKKFIKTALAAYAEKNGLSIDEIIGEINFASEHSIATNGEPTHEPTITEYAEADGTYIVASIDQASLDCTGIDTSKLDEIGKTSVVLSEWRDQCRDEINNGYCDVIDWESNLAQAFDAIGLDYDDYKEEAY